MRTDYNHLCRTEDDEATLNVQYEEVASEVPPLIQGSEWLGARNRMLIWVVGATGAALIHDLFYTTLDRQPADSYMSLETEYGIYITSQAMVNFFSNLITKTAVACLSAAIGVAFVQLFWWKMSCRSYAIKSVDGIMDFKSQPLNILSWKKAFSFRMLMIVAACVTIIQIGSALLPGSLTVVSGDFSSPCSVSTVDLSHADLADANDTSPTTGQRSYYIANGRASGLAGRVLLAGTASSPRNTCGTCSYNVTFVAPAVLCDDITQQSLETIHDLLPVRPHTNNIVVWSAFAARDGGNTLYIASRNLLTDTKGSILPADQLPVVALRCTGWNATYTVEIAQEGTTARMTTSTIKIENQITCEDLCNSNDTAGQQLLGLWGGLMQQLNGTVGYFTSTNEFALYASLAAWSSIGRGSSTGLAWQWSGNLRTLIPEIMQNISLSLLSGDLDDSEHNTTRTIQTQCTMKRLQYTYDRLRLRVTYGAALGLVSVCIACAFVALATLQRSESTSFSRILGAVPAKMDMYGSLTLDTVVRAGKDGRLIPLARQRLSQQDAKCLRLSGEHT